MKQLRHSHRIDAAQRGSALVLALFGILMFMTMVVGFTYDARSQSAYNAGFKLNSFYTQTARSILNTYGAENLQFEWVTPPREDGKDYNNWRFSPLLQGPGTPGKYGLKVEDSGSFSQNMGNLDLGYHIWVANNQDDPAVMFQGITVHTTTGDTALLDPSWDTDSRIVVTVEVFDNNDPNKVARATVSAMFGPSGSEPAFGYDDVPTLGDAGGGTLNQGTTDDPGLGNLDDYRP